MDDDDSMSPPELGDRSRSALELNPKAGTVKKVNQFAKNLGRVMEDSPQSQETDREFASDFPGKTCSGEVSTSTNLWNDAYKVQHVVEETRRCHSMSDLEHLEAAVWEIEDRSVEKLWTNRDCVSSSAFCGADVSVLGCRFLDVKEMVDDDVLQLMYDFECVRDVIPPSRVCQATSTLPAPPPPPCG